MIPGKFLSCFPHYNCNAVKSLSQLENEKKSKKQKTKKTKAVL